MKKIDRLFAFVGLLSASMVFQQCSSDDPSPQKNGDNIFFAGTADMGDDHWAPVYYNNGNITPIDDGSASTSIYGMTVSGEDVYAAGSRDNNAAYWKNGVVTIIPNSETTSWAAAYDVAVKGNDVYVLTYGLDGPGNFVKYFKNGVETPCSNGQPANMIVSDANDVYIAGYTNDKAGYWKNGEWVALTQLNSRGTSIRVIGNDVYVSGFYYDIIKSGWIPCYWKNGNLELINGEMTGMANDIQVVDDDVYLAGYSGGEDGYPVYWKNGVATPLSKADFTSPDAFSIAVKNGNVYVSGKDWNLDKSLLWKNGKLVEPFDGTQAGSFGSLVVE